VRVDDGGKMHRSWETLGRGEQVDIVRWMHFVACGLGVAIILPGCDQSSPEKAAPTERIASSISPSPTSAAPAESGNPACKLLTRNEMSEILTKPVESLDSPYARTPVNTVPSSHPVTGRVCGFAGGSSTRPGL
jgi:hypothetical protein